jgi:predicted dehydrogenase
MAGKGPVGVGIIGAGVISGTYIENLKSFADTELLAISDIIPGIAEAKAAEYGVPSWGTNEVVLNNPDVELVVNLTPPAVHTEVCGSAIAAGKHVWSEKPLGLNRETGKALLEAAEAAGLRVGCAPDTFLGEGLQAVKRVLASGAIGKPLSALFLMQQPGPDLWHPNPAFLFQEGAGPLFDIGPYYITAAVQMFGPVESVAAVGSKARDRRKIHAGPKAGEEFDVTVPSQTTGLLRFEGGQALTLVLSFDSAVSRILLEVTGSDASLEVPDPNMFDGDIKLRRPDGTDWEPVESTVAKSARGTGALDIARAIREDRPHRATGALAYHVLDVMVSIAEASETGQVVAVESTVQPSEPLPADWDPLAATV